MAAKTLQVLFFCLICLAHAFPISQELAISDIGLQSEVLYKTETVPVFGLDKVLARKKRHLIRYKQLTEGDYYD
ncbi:unnamed protein product [Arctia plantaginis]|uniref:Uncharacterized protein n=1 Tax=Arctia plantaginis TaxID=874455 RepID=A0A8S0Z5X2_ARCPL|nr:unnamed protein product [Arctia plantaginis]